MIYEWRTYEVFQRTQGALLRRFEHHAIPCMLKHGFQLIGFWETEIGERPEFSYLLAFDDLGHRERAWRAFLGDPEWIETKEKTEREQGPLYARVRNKIMRPTDFSPLK
jgi:NIPSNAP